MFFEGQWEFEERDTNGEAIKQRIDPLHIIVPIYHKIRLTYLDIEGFVAPFTRMLAKNTRPLDELEWDIRLAHSSKWKCELRDGPAPDTAKARVLAWQLPRFLWIATLRGPGEIPLVELVFDGTGIRRSYPLLEIIYFDDTLKERIQTVGRLATSEDFKVSRRLILFLQKQLADEKAAEVELKARKDARPKRPSTSRDTGTARSTAPSRKQRPARKAVVVRRRAPK